MSIVQPSRRPVDSTRRRSLLASIAGLVTAPAAALLGSKAVGSPIGAEIIPARIGADPEEPDHNDVAGGNSGEPFKQFLETYRLAGRVLQTVTEWWHGPAPDRYSVTDPDNPGVSICQYIICPYSGETFDPLPRPEESCPAEDPRD